MNEFSKSYLELVNGEFKGLNLTRIVDSEEFYHKQYLDSVLPFEKSDLIKEIISKHPLVIDIGFGGGFPILPLASCFKNLSFIGIETREKKLKAVKKIAEALNIYNVKFIHARSENINIDKNSLITFKAVGKVDELLNQLMVTADHVWACLYKGPNFFTEEKDNLKKLKGWELVNQFECEVPNTIGRTILIFKNKIKNVPRGTNKNLVKLSQIP